jgi:2-dehydro-3-deoxy-L-rhamnonate dehydrogenase (NAD+)
MGPDVSGNAAMVIGAGAGIGRATAALLAERGARVTCVDRDGAAAEAVAAQIREGGHEAFSAAADVTDPASVQEAIDAILARWGQIDALVNTAGIAGPTGVNALDVDLAAFDRVLSVNLRGALIATRAVLPAMLARGYGRISHVASIAGKDGNPGMVAYTASKAGLIGMVKGIGKEYAESGVTINALAPAVIRTALLDEQPQEMIDYMTARIPMGRCGELDEAAELLCWMSSPACSFTTGFTFDLSGGRATY